MRKCLLDFLGRKNYSCGGPNQMTFTCDSSNVPASSANIKFVPDSSDYIRFRKQQAMNRNYNDLKNGGDDHNASFVPLLRSRR